MNQLLKNIRVAFEISSWKRGYHQNNVFKVFENEFGEINIDTCMTTRGIWFIHHADIIIKVGEHGRIRKHLQTAFHLKMSQSEDMLQKQSRMLLANNCFSWILNFLNQFEKTKSLMNELGFECVNFHAYRYEDLIVSMFKTPNMTPCVWIFHGNNSYEVQRGSYLKALILYGRSKMDRFNQLPQKVRDLVFSSIEMKKENELWVCHEQD